MSLIEGPAWDPSYTYGATSIVAIIFQTYSYTNWHACTVAIASYVVTFLLPCVRAQACFAVLVALNSITCT